MCIKMCIHICFICIFNNNKAMQLYFEGDFQQPRPRRRGVGPSSEEQDRRRRASCGKFY